MVPAKRRRATGSSRVAEASPPYRDEVVSAVAADESPSSYHAPTSRALRPRQRPRHARFVAALPPSVLALLLARTRALLE